MCEWYLITSATLYQPNIVVHTCCWRNRMVSLNHIQINTFSFLKLMSQVPAISNSCRCFHFLAPILEFDWPIPPNTWHSKFGLLESQFDRTLLFCCYNVINQYFCYGFKILIKMFITLNIIWSTSVCWRRANASGKRGCVGYVIDDSSLIFCRAGSVS